MTFESPYSLSFLMIWVGLLVYLLQKNDPTVAVPHLALWPRSGRRSKSRRKLRLPLWWMMCLLGGGLLGILAAGRPMVPAPVRSQLTLVIDRGCSLADANCYNYLLQQCRESIGNSPIDLTLVPVPGKVTEASSSSWFAMADTMPATAVRDPAALSAAVQWALHHRAGPVWVLSGEKLDSQNERIVQLYPPAYPQAPGITHIAAADSPQKQVMVQVHSPRPGDVMLQVRSGKTMIDRRLIFSAAGNRTEFIDCPQMGSTVSARLAVGMAPNQAAYLSRTNGVIRIDAGSDLPAPVQRLASLIQSDQPEAAVARRLLITTDALPANVGGLMLLASAVSPSSSAVADTGAVVIAAHPVTADVHAWPPAVVNAKPPQGFQVVVSRGDVPLVAVADSPRRAWVNLNTTRWSLTADFVIFFGNTIDWLSADSAAFSSIAPTLLPAGAERVDRNPTPLGTPVGLWPGLYRLEDGSVCAVNAQPWAETTGMPLGQADSRGQAVQTILPHRSLGGYVAMAALLMIWLGAWLARTR